jgi:phosphatidyl-myo-inositol dimannoside synthase
MRTLLITWNYPPKIGGIEMMLSELVSSLRQRVEVQVIAPMARVPAPSHDVIRVSRPGLLWFMLEALWIGRQELRRQAYDVIVAGSALTVPVALVLGRLFRLPVLANIYGLDVIYPHPLYQFMIRRLLPRCERVVAISEATQVEAVERGVDPDRIGIVHPGIRFAEFEVQPDIGTLKDELGFTNYLVLLSAGRLAKRKGVLEFVRYSLPSIIEKCPEVLLVVVGGNPVDSLNHTEDIQSEISAEAERQGLDRHVRILGRVERDQLLKLFFASDVFVLPAIHVDGDMEGFGIVLVEASAAGKPLVSVQLGGISDAVDEKGAVLVEAGDWEGLSAAVVQLAGDTATREQMGCYGRKRAQELLDWSVVAHSYFNELQQCFQDVGR